MSIKKYKKNGKFGFKSDKIKVEFSKPHIQAHDDYAFCKTEKGILYYYYSVRIKSKFYKKWERVVDIYTHDFPEIINFKSLLEAFLLDKIDISNYQKDTNSFDTVWKTYTVDTGFFCDDYYSITGNLIDKEEGIQEKYSVTIGKSLDYSTHEVVGITLNHLTREELSIIYDCVCEFIDYSIDEHNKGVREYIKNSISSWQIKGGKLYEIENGKIKSIYVKGDIINDAIVLMGDLNSDSFYSTEYHNFVIDDIKDDCIFYSSGYEENRSLDIRRIEEMESISIKELIYIFPEVNDEKLNYNEDEICSDFISILSDSEKEEFKNSSVDVLFDKWKEAIMDRTWMCRTEHNLPVRVKETGYHENVYASIKVIVNNIKNSV